MFRCIAVYYMGVRLRFTSLIPNALPYAYVTTTPPDMFGTPNCDMRDPIASWLLVEMNNAVCIAHLLMARLIEVNH